MRRTYHTFLIRAEKGVFRCLRCVVLFSAVFLAVSCASGPSGAPDIPGDAAAGAEIPPAADSSEYGGSSLYEEETAAPEDGSAEDGRFAPWDETASVADDETERDGGFSESGGDSLSFGNDEMPDVEFEQILPESLPELPESDEKSGGAAEEAHVPVIVEPEVQDVENGEENELPLQDSDEKEDLFSPEPEVSDDGKNDAGENAAVSEGGGDDSSGETEPHDDAASESDGGETAASAPVPSRSLTVKRNQQIDIVYPGKGWVYQENIDENGNHDVRSRNFIFGGRKLGGENQSFTLRSRVPGTFLLHFYKNDMLTGTYIDDYLEVIVKDESAEKDEAHAVAPDYASVVPPKAGITAETVHAARKEAASDTEKQASVEPPAETGESGGSGEQLSSEKTERFPDGASAAVSSEEPGARTVVQTSESKPDEYAPSVKTPRRTASRAASSDRNTADEAESAAPADADSLLKSARLLYDKKQYPQAFDMIQQFFDSAAEKIDEGLYLQGQILEAKSDVQNIKGAVDSYDLLMKNYPTSRLWNDAKKRSIYLKRFYLNIR